MDLKLLRSFVAVAEGGSLARASDRLHLAQPALSRQIRLLEHEIGAPLFLRSTRGMRLTEQGAQLFARVPALIAELDGAIDSVRALSAAPSGAVTLGVIPTVSNVLAGRLAVRCARELPGVALRILEAYAGHLIDWTHRGEVDLAIVYGRASEMHLPVSDLMFEELVLVAPKGSTPGGSRSGRGDDGDGDGARSPGEGPVPVATLGTRDLVLPSRPHGLRMVVEAAAGRAGVRLAVRFEADSFRVLLDLVAAGLGATVLPLSAFGTEDPRARFDILRLDRPRITRRLVLVSPPRRDDSRATTALRALLLDEIGRMRAAGDWPEPGAARPR
ncbi:LysR substrate-binding domain-containing protein [Frigidibacter sp. MR17.24]|uniref:LysR substrate-binding domain-containing protein n=1 Tax=Frigidibacter sp. MR17.24 TaxID=3127345 RepID=UPI003012FB2A